MVDSVLSRIYNYIYPLTCTSGERRFEMRKPVLYTIPEQVDKAVREAAKRKGVSNSFLVSAILADRLDVDLSALFGERGGGRKPKAAQKDP